MQVEKADTLVGMPKHGLPAQMAFVEAVLGHNHIKPQEVSQQFGWEYTPEQLETLYAVLVENEILLWLSANQCALVPLPPTVMDIREVLHLDSPAADAKPVDYAEPVSLKAGGWLVVRYGGSGTVFASWQPTERMLNAAETIYGVTLYQKLRGVNLLESSFVMTSTQLRNGRRAHVAYPGTDHFVVKGIWPNDRWDYMSGLTL
jgi:hypothetical protein